MKSRCVVLLSGGLDSMLAVRIMQEQNIEVEALNFKTIFACCQDQAGQAARELGVRLTVVGQQDDYLEVVRKPKFGYGKGANPCVDCRIYMFDLARQFMKDVDAQFIVSGEVVGQRPKSQKRRDLEIISHHSDLKDLLLRPLSAKLLPPTKPELEGVVDRDRLYDIAGRGRKRLLELADKFGLKDAPSPSTGCALTEPRFAKKVHDLIQLEPTARRWDYEMLKYGRHFRLNSRTKVIVGRRESENEYLEVMHNQADSQSAALLTPDGFAGPTALVVGPLDSSAVEFAGGMLYRYGKPLEGEAGDDAMIRVQQPGEAPYRIPPRPSQAADYATTLADDPARSRKESA